MNGAIVTIVLVLSLNRGFAIEPACSSFSYVEQILEKVIRQEIHVEKMKTDIEDTKQVMLGALADLKTERNKYALDMDNKTEDVKALKETMEEEMTRMKSQADENLEDYSKGLKNIKDTKQVVLGALADLKTERNKYALDMDKKTEDVKALKETMEEEMTRMKSQADENLEEYSKELNNFKDTKQVVLGALADLKTERNKYALDMDKKTEDVKALKETMEEEMTRMKSQADENLEEYSKELKNIKETTTTPIIAFKAHKVTDKSVSNKKIIVFTQNIINIGDSYNSETGIFVAPVGGIYLFTAQICLTQGSHSYYGITVKGSVISAAAFGEREWIKCYTMDAISAVNKGDEVSVKCTNSCSSSYRLLSNSYATSSFSGVLIQRSDNE